MTKRRWREGVGLTALNVFFIALCFLTLIPILYALSVSFSGSNSLLINLLPLVENLFALGQKPFRHRSKTFSTKGEK